VVYTWQKNSSSIWIIHRILVKKKLPTLIHNMNGSLTLVLTWILSHSISSSSLCSFVRFGNRKFLQSLFTYQIPRVIDLSSVTLNSCRASRTSTRKFNSVPSRKNEFVSYIWCVTFESWSKRNHFCRWWSLNGIRKNKVPSST